VKDRISRCVITALAARSNRDEACGQAEDLADDQALVIDSPAGLVELLGCAHAGVVNTLTYVLSLTGRTRVHAVIGRMHLLASLGSAD